MASDLVTGISMLLFKEAEEDKINLGSINIGVNLCGSKMSLLQNYLNKLDVNNPIYTCTSGTLFAPLDTRDSILSVIKQKLNTYCIRPSFLYKISSLTYSY